MDGSRIFNIRSARNKHAICKKQVRNGKGILVDFDTLDIGI